MNTAQRIGLGSILLATACGRGQVNTTPHAETMSLRILRTSVQATSQIETNAYERLETMRMAPPRAQKDTLALRECTYIPDLFERREPRDSFPEVFPRYLPCREYALRR